MIVILLAATMQVGSVPVRHPLPVQSQVPDGGLECEMRSTAGDLLRIRLSLEAQNKSGVIITPIAADSWPSAAVKGPLTGGGEKSNAWIVESPSGTLQIQLVARDGGRNLFVQRIVTNENGRRIEPFAAVGFCKDRLQPSTQPVAVPSVDPFDPARWVAHTCYFTSPETNPTSGSFHMIWTRGTTTWLLGSPGGFPWNSQISVKYAYDPKMQLGSQDTIMGLTYNFGDVAAKVSPSGSYHIMVESRSMVASSLIRFTSINGDNSAGLAVCGEKAVRTSDKGVTFQ